MTDSPFARDPAAFEALAGALFERAAPVDRTSLYLRAEASDFLRFNHGALRQATHVEQAQATLAVERGLRRAESTLALAGTPSIDLPLLAAERDALAAMLDLIPDDPWLQVPTAPTASHRDEPGAMPETAALVARLHEATGLAARHDLVGFHAAGPVAHAFADSLGSRHWHRVESFHFDACLHHRSDQAVKTAYAGTRWDDDAFAARLEDAARRLPLYGRTPHTLKTGRYRALLSPAAVVDLLSVLGWGGFSLKARRTESSPLMRLARGEVALHRDVTLSEDFARGLAPAFTPEGFARPRRVPLIDAGRCAAGGGTLNSPRSAREYGLEANGANAGESPEALHLAAGTLAEDDLLQTLGTGLDLSNLWYLNFSDRQACRVTGMTRHACSWVEDGRRVAPIDVMRFDVDLLRLFGEGLQGLADRAEFVPSNGTYGARQLGSVTTPAALVDGFEFTL